MGLFSSKNQPENTKTAAEKSQNFISDKAPSATEPAAPDATAISQQTAPPSNDEDTRPDLTPEEAQKHAAVGKQMVAAFGSLVTLLMRSDKDRARPIGDLEWMIAPAITTGQFAIADAQSKKTGAISPIGGVLWAMVSEEIDAKLSNTSNEQVQLQPQDWRSGTIPWIVLAMGDKRVVAGLIKKLSTNVFKDQAPKIRSQDKDGKFVVGRVQASDQSEATQ